MLPTDPGDRNRTSPFAFTGNRFEFRAPGSLQSIAGPMVTINTILAEALDYIATELEALVAEGTEFNAAVQTVLQEIITNHGKVVFNDDGYADEWQVEAAERGLPNLRTTLDALPELITEESMELFSKYGVFNHREMHSRYEIALEQYILAIDVEAELTLEMANTMILPAAAALPDRVGHQRGQPEGGRGRGRHSAPSTRCPPRSPSCGRASPRCGRRSTTTTWSRRRSTPSTPRRASCRPWTPSGRRPTPSRRLVADDLWPLPTYQEMLFIL